jgi:arylsulfatase A-like enzyme
MTPTRTPLFFLTDDQRADALSCAGNSILRTPNIDRLAREGMTFRNAFVTNALCAPSRASFLTGLYSHAHGVPDNANQRIPEAIPLVSDLLRKAGYEVAFCGKSHMAGALRNRTWDYYFGYQGQGNYLRPRAAEMRDGKIGPDEPYTGYMDDVVTDKALGWLKGRGEKPFCLFVFFKAPHRSWERAPRHAELFKDAVIPRPGTYGEAAQGHPGKPRAFAEADNKIGNAPDVQNLDFVKDYYATLTAVDENVGRVLKAVDDVGLRERTAVVYSSDNGFFHGEWGLYDKRLMHEPSIRVPLLVRLPGTVRAGAVEDRMAINVDVAPTLLELAGEKVPESMHGRSLAPLLRGRETAWRKDWLYEYFEFPGPHSVRKNRGVRTERWKLIHYFEAPEEWELYDLQADPGERRNLADDPAHAGTRAELRARLRVLEANPRS